jgi:histidyl-tRNA synthetase
MLLKAREKERREKVWKSELEEEKGKQAELPGSWVAVAVRRILQIQLIEQRDPKEFQKQQRSKVVSLMMGLQTKIRSF